MVATFAAAQKSSGHLAFIGTCEYYGSGREVLVAKIADPIMTDGRRFGRFECYAHSWAAQRDRLVAVFGEHDGGPADEPAATPAVRFARIVVAEYARGSRTHKVSVVDDATGEVLVEFAGKGILIGKSFYAAMAWIKANGMTEVS